MTLRETTIIEWETTPRELRELADTMPYFSGPRDIESEKGLILRIHLDQSKWLQEQAEEKE